MKLVHLVQVFNDVEADIVEGLLKDCGIVSIRKYKGAKGYMKVVMGTAMGVDIYVKPEDYKEAKEILESINLNEE
ncbi:putative signal transducing protein [Lutispora thermophila]|uniref:Putative signal transducing protein n=1 Tax=Lutispora thermophila DSM 19022 TaxID=1122184 RepID=A0A1M6AZK8_9FIRM|nr:DUF2007 domain-containing protein [Lutispora thermophila]SHI41915.1 Putative signal transducing protein [Lutispora thermophila DSM 19022]